MHSFTHAFIHPFTHSSIHPFIHTFIHPSIHSFIHSFIKSINHSFNHTSPHSLIHSFMHACIHYLSQAPKRQREAAACEKVYEYRKPGESDHTHLGTRTERKKKNKTKTKTKRTLFTFRCMRIDCPRKKARIIMARLHLPPKQLHLPHQSSFTYDTTLASSTTPYHSAA